MTIKYRNTIGDRLVFAIYQLPRTPLILLMSFGFLAFLTYDSVFPIIPKEKSFVIQAIVFTVSELVLVVFILIFWMVIILVTTLISKNKLLAMERTMTLTEESFLSEAEYGKSEFKWTAVHKIVRKKNYIYIYINKQSAVVIPRRSFESPAQWDEFYSLCKNRRLP